MINKIGRTCACSDPGISREPSTTAFRRLVSPAHGIYVNEVRVTSSNKVNGGQKRFAIVAVLLATGFSLLLAEVVVRIALPYNTPDTIRKYSLQYAPSVYSRNLLKPVDALVEIDSAKAWGAKAEDEPADLSVFINANGYRGPPFTPRKPAGITRIIILGGSSVFDHGSADNDLTQSGAWPFLLGENLRKKGFDSLEIINAGIPTHATSDSLGRMFSQLWIYEPDYVLIYHGWNDIKFWKAREITPDRPLIKHVQPYDVKSNPLTSYQGFWDRLLSNSQIYIKLRNRYFLSRTQIGLEGIVEGAGRRESSYGEFGPRQFRLNLELIVAAARSVDAVPVLITQATLVTSESTAADRSVIGYDYQDLNHDALVNAFRETYEIIRNVAGRTGVRVIDVAQELSGRREYFLDHVHLTPEGSAALATSVADGLAPILEE